jgi:c-di-AMP phosphodiesterase-like protein
MSEQNNNFDKLKQTTNKSPEKNINKLVYTFLEKYSKKKSVIDKLMTFETSK